MEQFPDFSGERFDINQYNQRFRQSNVIIHAFSSHVAYPEHWGCLSVKCAFHGSEFYESQGCRYAVSDANFLVFNEGKTYSSYIHDKKEVELFTINFSPAFEKEVTGSMLRSDLLQADDPYNDTRKIEFNEKLYLHDKLVSPVIYLLKKYSHDFENHRHQVEELYYRLLERLVLLQESVQKEIKQIPATKLSTQKEIYKRLHYAKDYMDSCCQDDITLTRLSAITCLNAAYFLRQFRRYFKITPRQYLINKRMETAFHLLKQARLSVTEVCYEVGYTDPVSFSKLFFQYYGINPGRFRAQYLKKSIFTCIN